MTRRKPTRKELNTFWEVFNKKHHVKPYQTELDLKPQKEQK